MTFGEVTERLAQIGWSILLTDEGKVRTFRTAADGQTKDQREYETLAEAYEDTVFRNAS